MPGGAASAQSPNDAEGSRRGLRQTRRFRRLQERLSESRPARQIPGPARGEHGGARKKPHHRSIRADGKDHPAARLTRCSWPRHEFLTCGPSSDDLTGLSGRGMVSTREGMVSDFVLGSYVLSSKPKTKSDPRKSGFSLIASRGQMLTGTFSLSRRHQAASESRRVSSSFTICSAT